MTPGKLIIVFFSFGVLLIGHQPLIAQEETGNPKFYLGLSYGTSIAIGDFRDTDIQNPDAGFAENGRKIDVYGGVFLTDRTTLTATFRTESFETNVEDLIDMFTTENPGVEFTGSTEDWQTYYFLVGVAYRVSIGPKFNFFPRVGLGPLFATNPGISVDAPGSNVTNNYRRSSETGIGLGYEFGVGLQTNLGRHFALLPTFTFCGGLVKIDDVATTTDNRMITRSYQPYLQSFTLGLSVAYRFY